MGGVRKDEPVTPAGRLFLQPNVNQVINCALGGKYPINIEAVKSAIRDSIMLVHPRFYSIMVTDSQGREYWRKTTVDVDRHIIVLHEPVCDSKVASNEEAVNDYLADLAVSSPLSYDKPLWEVHLLMAHNCAVTRVHHALGDGISLMSMLLTFCRRADDPKQLPTIKYSDTYTEYINRLRSFGFWGWVKVMWLTVVYVLELIMRTLWIQDKKTPMTGGAGVELWPRKVATAKFLFEDMKTVKNAVPHATINDVFWGLISSGLSRYLDMQSSKAVEEGHQITGVAMVNLRQQPGLQEHKKLLEGKSASWGNKFSPILLPVYYHKRGYDPLYYVKRAKSLTSQKKQSLEAYFTYKIFDLIMSIIGPKLACLLHYKILSNTTFTISNMVGPREEITIADNTVEFMRVTATGLPHAITMHMVTYAGRADMQILVAKDIIPDPQVLAKCFQDALLEMKEAATVEY